MIRRTLAIALTATVVGGPAAAQYDFDVTDLEELEDTDVVSQSGETIGEVEEALIDGSGKVAAVAVEVGGFLDIGDTSLVVPMDRLSFDDGDYVVSMSPQELESLQEWDD